jgi:hypothetical protein
VSLGAVLLTGLLAGISLRRGPGRTRRDPQTVLAAVADAGYTASLQTP